MRTQYNSKLLNWIHNRYDISGLEEFIRHKKVPVHNQTIWYYMGGVTLFLFLIQVVTGILLLMYYIPGEDSAYESVRFIVTEVEFGWLIRNIHSWSANIMVLFVFIHMFSVFFTKAYKNPRELTWVSGVILLVLVLAFGFSGYLLPWNELAYFATKVGTDIIGVVPIIGEKLENILRGGDNVTGSTLSRFFGIHVAILPALFILLLVIHILFVQRQGMSEPEGFSELPEKKKRYIPFFPNFVLKDLLFWLIVLDIILFLTVFFPWDLGIKADPLAPAPKGIKPEWYFMFMFQTLKFIPAHVLFIEGEMLGVLSFGAAGILWMLLPFLKIKNKKIMGIRMIPLLGTIIILYIIIMTLIGYME